MGVFSQRHRTIIQLSGSSSRVSIIKKRQWKEKLVDLAGGGGVKSLRACQTDLEFMILLSLPPDCL